MDLATNVTVTRPKFTPCSMTQLDFNHFREIAKGKGLRSMRFSNQKLQEMVLHPNDLLKGVGGDNVSTKIIEESRNLRKNLPVTEEESSGLLDGREVVLEMDEETTDEKIADLQEDKKQSKQTQESNQDTYMDESTSTDSIQECNGDP